jgi:PadR family transcriptional regulator, regulatory protein PadR
MKPEVLKGHVDLLLLATLERAPAHGYRVVEALRERSQGAFDLAEGTVYPALYRLERGGLVTSRWQVVEGRRRRVYELTKAGRTALGQRRGRWFEFADAMGTALT